MNIIQKFEFTYGRLFIITEGRSVRLNDVISAANVIRAKKKLNKIPLINYTRSGNFVESVLAAEMKLGLRKSGDFSGKVPNIRPDGTVVNYAHIDSDLVKTAFGRFGGTWVHPFIAIDAAAHLDKELAMDLYEILMTSSLFQQRESNGDFHKELLAAVRRILGDTSQYLNKMRLLDRVIAARAGLDVPRDNTTWDDATTAQLQIKNKLQEMMVFVINNGLARSFTTVLELAAMGEFAGVPKLPPVDIDELVKKKVSELNALESMLL